MLKKHFTTLHLLYTFQEHGTLHRHFHFNNTFLVPDNTLCLTVFINTSVVTHILHRNKSDTNSKKGNRELSTSHAIL
jgi:hypothetical protein